MKEFEFLEKLRRNVQSVEGVRLGIGDDAAILEPGRFDLVTVDTIVEGVHFKMDWASPDAIGWRLLACNLSDIAAMGGAPGAYLLSVSLGPGVGESFLDGVLDGMLACGAAFVPTGFETGLIGGDTTRSPKTTVLSLTMMGEAPPAGPILRSGARPGDRICLLGPLGESSAGLALLEHLESEGKVFERSTAPEHWTTLVDAYLYPQVRVKEGALLGLHGLANSLIDVSDGLVQDLGHILQRSQVGARLDAARVPVSPALRRVAAELSHPLVEWVLTGGEGYALVCTCSPDKAGDLWEVAREHGFEVHDIGEIREEREGFKVVDAVGEPIELDSYGYEHELGGSP